MAGSIMLDTAQNDINNGKFPWWVRAISFVGAPTAIAIYLVWVMTTSLDARLTNIQENLRLHQVDSTYAMKAADAQNAQLLAMHRLLVRICANTARTAEDRNVCWDQWR